MRVLRLLVALALTFGSVNSAFADDDAALRRLFFDSEYTVCDAHFVAKTFDFELSEAKAYIGQKIQWGTTDILEGDLTRAREKGMADRAFACQFYMTGLEYSDAEALAKYWGLSVSDAKARVEQKIHYGNEGFLRNVVLPEAKGQPVGGGDTHADDSSMYKEGPEDGVDVAARQSDFEAFVQSRYDYCHAKMLVGSYFGSSVEEVKNLIGYKVRMDWGEMVETQLEATRHKHQATGSKPCGFADTPYTYDDAMALAEVWGISVDDAKGRVEEKYAMGAEQAVRTTLDQVRESETEGGVGPEEPADARKKKKKGK